MELCGVVMCGGKSSRMEQDKGLLLQNNKTWASMAAQKLKPFVSEVYFSINLSQFATYSQVFEISKLIPDRFDVHGPLGGLLSAHQKLESMNLLIIACDMIDIKPITIENLVYHFNKYQKPLSHLEKVWGDTSEACVYKNKTEFEPLLGIYTAKGLDKLIELITQNKLQKHSMKHTLELLNSSEILIQDSQMAEFKNYNTQNDILL